MSRRRHDADLYDGRVRDGRPFAVVHGNCQAGALRLLLAGSPTFGWQPLRVPPVHELTADDLPAYDRLLGAATLLVSQPVRPGYRGLPLGTAEVAARLAAGARTVRMPVVRDAGLHPWQATLDHPGNALLIALARRVQVAVGAPAARLVRTAAGRRRRGPAAARRPAAPARPPRGRG